jgi:hypothetical protein
MAEALIAGAAFEDRITAVPQSLKPPWGGIVFEADHGRVVETPGVESRRRLAAEHPPGRAYRLAWVLGEGEDPDKELEEDLRLGVGAHSAKDGIDSAGGPGDEQRGERMWRSASGSVFSRVARL